MKERSYLIPAKCSGTRCSHLLLQPKSNNNAARRIHQMLVMGPRRHTMTAQARPKSGWVHLDPAQKSLQAVSVPFPRSGQNGPIHMLSEAAWLTTDGLADGLALSVEQPNE